MKPRTLGWHALMILLLIPPAIAATKPVAVHGAWVREAPPGAEVMAAYLVLENPSARPRTLRRVTSPQFSRVEIHRTELHDGMASMVPQDHVTIPARGRLSFAPESYHLMLIGSRRALHAGDQVTLTLHFDGVPPLRVVAPVRRAAMDGGHPPHAH